MIAGILILIALKRAGAHYYIIIGALFVILGIMAYALSDTVTSPKIELTKTNQTVNGTVVPAGIVTSVSCDPSFVYRPDKNDCYNSSPFGHTIVDLFSMLAGVFTISAIVESTFKSWRMYLTPKILYLLNQYSKENKPIPRSIDVHRSGDYVWTFKGFGALKVSKEDEIHVAYKDSVFEVGNILTLFKGACQRISPDALFVYVGYDEAVFSLILQDYLTDIDLITHKFITEPDLQPAICVPLRLTYEEYTPFLSIKDAYDFGSDRFSIVIEELLKMRRSIERLGPSMAATSDKTLTSALKLAGKAAVIGDQVGKLRRQEVIGKETMPQRPYEDKNYGERQVDK